MTDLDAKALRERCERRMGGLCRQRQPWESQWRSVADYFQVRRSRWLAGDAWKAGQTWPMGGDEKVNTKLLDPTGVRASETLANGLSSGLISPSRPWFRLQSADPDMRDKQAVKEWLKLVQDAIYNLFATTNFYSQSKAAYKELGLFGVEAGIITQHWRKGLVTHALAAGEYWLGVGDDLVPDTLYRACPMTVAQIVQTFAPPYGTGAWSNNVRQAYDAGRYDEVVAVMHAIEPNPERIPGRTDAANKAWRSIYWEVGQSVNAEGAGVLQLSGFDVQPFWAARWEPMGMQPYSVGPGLSALGDGKQLQLQVLRRSQGRDLQTRPHMLVPSSMDRFNGVVPGGISSVNTVDQVTVRPLVDPRLVNMQGLSEDIGQTQQQVKDAFYTPLFLAILEADGQMTATEVNLRNMEKYAQLGPVIEANMNEKLRPIIDIAFALLHRTGQLPPAPQELQGQPLDVVFVSQLAQLQRAGEINAIAQSVQFRGGLVAVDPQIMDGLDLDKTCARFDELQGLDADLERSDDAIQALRADRAKQQQAAQLQAAAPAAKDGAQAAATLAGIDPAKIAGLTQAAA